MSYKRISKLLLLLIILLLSLSAVSAIDNSTNVVQNNSISDSDTITQSNNLNNRVGDTNSGSFTDLQTIINNAPAGSNITLDKNYVYNNITDSGPIMINKTLSINGNNFTLDGNKQSQILTIKGTVSNVILNNINFINGYVNRSSGSAVYSLSKNLEIKNCQFENNTATCYGGAIYSGGVNSTISNCFFINNTGKMNGGAIYISGAGSLIKNSTFIKNFADRGGAVCIYSKNTILKDSNFINNNASYGGAVFVYTQNVTITNSSFNNNIADKEGGAIEWQGTDGILKNASFYNNSAGYYGGAVRWDGTNGVLNNSVLNNNSAGYYGGAVRWDGTNGVLNNSVLNNNSAGYYGGAVRWDGTNGVLNNSVLNNNSAYNAGAILFDSNNTLVDNCRFINNSATKYTGGAINDFGMNLNNTISNSVFKNNSAMISGGAISVCNATIVNSTFEDNSAIFGGAMYVINSTINNSTFKNNSAKVKGNSVYAINKVTLNNCSINPNDVVNNLLDKRLETINNYNYTYTVTGDFYGFCTERYLGGALDGIRDDSLKLLRNSLNGEDISEYLKILIYTFVNKEEDINNTNLTHAVWIFTDYDFRNSNDPIVKKVLELYDSGLRIPNVNASKRLNNGSIIFYNFSSLITPALWQNLVLFKFRYADITENLTKETLNKTTKVNNTVEFKISLTNTGNETIHNAFIQDNDYSNGLVYQGWRNVAGNWTYDAAHNKWILNNPLNAGQTVSIIVLFKAIQNGTLTNNVSSGFDNITLFNSTNTTKVVSPNLSVVKITNNKTVFVGQKTSFTIVVRNTGDYRLTNVFVVEKDYDGLIYDSFLGPDWIKSGNKFIYKKVLGVGESANFTVFFKTTKVGNFTNIIMAGSNETGNTTVNNTTRVVNKVKHDKEESGKKVKQYVVKEIDIEKTGNPILLLLMALLLIPLLKRKY
ncbi:hypothetical protein BGI41_01580 [Methanobrevibacter sp. 87.7]|uniref:right-handed parallel beta-helix repeat-containing protein n=1 Tax=Methanobrevibacter sp. 87.7 TaxID=387957 RepID=UPI000B6A4FEE|nr:DUF11 domain-containing protein [Methanobrevibacter sp. 87.7]OWT33602.1 hypothetical protein BGI41_01580 [Methanobrevibacter sp. 87.7]